MSKTFIDHLVEKIFNQHGCDECDMYFTHGLGAGKKCPNFSKRSTTKCKAQYKKQLKEEYKCSIKQKA